MKKLFKLTEEGIEDLKIELDTLIAKRPIISESIRAARELGDLAENAEYQSAREEQERLENRISEIEAILQNTEIIRKSKSNKVIGLGSRVKIKNDKGVREFQIVGTVEADPLNGKISDVSLIGSSLLNKKLGDMVEIKTTQDVSSYKIIEIF
ncbi:MAG: transcription elongation factor GreA [Patescibacteria group bacterium]|jgi:transcription elongation factor GreA|nr:transcription elongation factor GreA [Patescibacteria group bacterium]